MSSTTADPSFDGAGQTPGIEIWRVENLKVVKQDSKLNGKFYSGDSYLILHTMKKKTALEWDLHFWLGTETTQDEKGIAAYKTVELDDFLGGGPVQYREVQNHESKRFMEMFPNGVEYLSGGIESGFKKVDRDAYTKKLLHIKGKKNIRAQQVPLTYKSLNHGDVFVLDDGKTIYCWNGKQSSKKEKVKATEIARKIRDEERGGKSKVVIIDSGIDSETRFFTALGDKGEIKSAEDGGDDSEFEKSNKTVITLYRVSDASGELTIEECAKAPLKQDDLDPDDCFIVDAGQSGVLAWIGKKCTPQEKKAAMSNAVQFIHEKGYPDYTQVTRIVQGGETPLFKQCFNNWKDANQQDGLGKIQTTNKVAKYDDSSFDVNTLHKKAEKAKEKLPDDGKGMYKIWRIEKFQKKEIPESEYGVFSEGDCYLIFYTYRPKNRDEFIIYFWQGLKSTTDERGASALLAQQLDDEYGGAPVQVRVVQNKEPEHFLRIFQGKMIIRKGGVEGAFRSRSISEIENRRAPEDVILYHIKGTNELNTRAVEVTARAASLNSNDVFLMKLSDKAFVWEGSGASDDEKAFAEVVADYAAPDGDLVIVREGKETEEFWANIGGKEEYASAPRLAETKPEYQARLFQCSNASGKFKVEEVLDFDQDDLCEDDVMLLDTYEEVFVWVGSGANFIEKKESLNTAIEYIKSEESERTPDNTGILQVKQGYEPFNFTGYFMGWDAEKWSDGKSYDDIKKEMEAGVGLTTVKDELDKYNKTYSYEELTQKDVLCDGVDPCNKERHLSDAEFEKYFCMNKEAFSMLPNWKREQAKRKNKLF